MQNAGLPTSDVPSATNYFLQYISSRWDYREIYGTVFLILCSKLLVILLFIGCRACTGSVGTQASAERGGKLHIWGNPQSSGQGDAFGNIYLTRSSPKPLQKTNKHKMREVFLWMIRKKQWRNKLELPVESCRDLCCICTVQNVSYMIWIKGRIV